MQNLNCNKINLIGVDFSINKPAVCIYINNSHIFYSWPYNLKNSLKELYRENSINLIDRLDNKYIGKDSSEKMRWEILNALYLSSTICNNLKSYLNEDTLVAFEGFSYGSQGNVALQLGGYKYMLMARFQEFGVPLCNMYTFAPITIKKTAGCAKKGMGKKEMIEAFLRTDFDIPLIDNIHKNLEAFKKKGGKNYIDHLDDIVDSFWILKTLQEKISLKSR